LRRRDITDEDLRTDDQLTRTERMAFGNLLAIVQRGVRFDFTSRVLNRGLGAWADFFPDILASLDPSDMAIKFTYEPDFRQIRTSSDPRFTRSADPNDPESARYREALTRFDYR